MMIEVLGSTMAQFAGRLSGRLDRIAVDKTCITFAPLFTIEMRYLALRDFSRHLERVKMRADAGGHGAPESVLRAIYEASIRNLRGRFGRRIFCTFTTTARMASRPQCCCRPRAARLSTWQKTSQTGWRQHSGSFEGWRSAVRAGKLPSHDWLVANSAGL